jgi:putative FmdB family regulatory protein
MPEYDYHCDDCDHDFALELSMSDHAEKERKQELRCPKCEGRRVRHVIQSVNVMTSKKS